MTNRLVKVSSKNVISVKSYGRKTDFPLFIVEIGGKNRFLRIYARTNAKIKNRRKIISGKFKELSNELSLALRARIGAEKIVNGQKHTHTYIKKTDNALLNILIYTSLVQSNGPYATRNM